MVCVRHWFGVHDGTRNLAAHFHRLADRRKSRSRVWHGFNLDGAANCEVLEVLLTTMMTRGPKPEG
eukprot:3088848-Amphidinium_carterae.2